MHTNEALAAAKLRVPVSGAVTRESVASLASLLRLFEASLFAIRRTEPLEKLAIDWAEAADEASSSTSAAAAEQLSCAAELYDVIGEKLLETKQYAVAHSRLLRGADDALHVRCLKEWAASGNDDEHDLFLARAVLQALTFKRLSRANALVEESGLITDSPLSNFLRFLLLTLERDEATRVFQTLRQRYAPALSRDESFSRYLDFIGQAYYNIQPRGAGGGGMPNIMNLMSMLGGGR